MKLPDSKPIAAAFSLRGSKDYRWHEKPDESFRRVGPSHKIRRMGHAGWYCDSFQYSTTFGVVFRLANKRGFVAACSDPWNTDKHGHGPVVFDFTTTYETEREAAGAADRIAQLYAELCQEDEARFIKEQEAEEAAKLERDAREMELAVDID